MTGVERIAAERQRQIEAGRTGSSDYDTYGNASVLVLAAICYATPNPLRKWKFSQGVPTMPAMWPWTAESWKPGDRIRELEKAGALIAAEIDRLVARDGT